MLRGLRCISTSLALPGRGITIMMLNLVTFSITDVTFANLSRTVIGIPNFNFGFKLK